MRKFLATVAIVAAALAIAAVVAVHLLLKM